MTARQKNRFANIVAQLCALRDECDAADRFELGCLILETAPVLARPTDPDQTAPDPYDCIR